MARIWFHGWKDSHLGHAPPQLAAIRTEESFHPRAAQRVSDTTVAVVACFSIVSAPPMVLAPPMVSAPSWCWHRLGCCTVLVVGTAFGVGTALVSASSWCRLRLGVGFILVGFVMVAGDEVEPGYVASHHRG